MKIIIKKRLAKGTLIINELQSQIEIFKAFPVMKQLLTHLDEETYLELVTETNEKDMNGL